MYGVLNNLVCGYKTRYIKTVTSNQCITAANVNVKLPKKKITKEK